MTVRCSAQPLARPRAGWGCWKRVPTASALTAAACLALVLGGTSMLAGAGDTLAFASAPRPAGAFQASGGGAADDAGGPVYGGQPPSSASGSASAGTSTITFGTTDNSADPATAPAQDAAPGPRVISAGTNFGASSPAPAAQLPQSAASSGGVNRVAGKTATSARGASVGTQVTGTATCPVGQSAIAGGGVVTTSDNQNQQRAVLSASYPSSDSTWIAVGVIGDSALSPVETLDVTAVAICSPSS